MSNPVAATDRSVQQSNLTASDDGESPAVESLVTTRGQLKQNNKRVRFNDSVKQYKRPRTEFQGQLSKTMAVAEPHTNQSKSVKLAEPSHIKPQISTADESVTRVFDVAPIVYATASHIQSVLPQRAFTVLLDSGSTNTLINKRSLPYGAVPFRAAARRTTTTMGSFDSSSSVQLQEVKFPQFANCIIGTVKADVFDSPGCRYDIIVGRDVLLRMGIKLDFRSKLVKWLEQEIPMKITKSL